MIKMECFTIESVIRGYHIYKEVWEASLGEMMTCAIELGNAFDLFAVLVVRDREIIGHVPRKISAACSLLLRHRGCITC